MPKVQIYTPVDETGESYERMTTLGITVKDGLIAGRDTAPDPKSEVAIDADTDAMAGYVRPITAEGMARAPDLRIIANYTVGFDNVDLTAASAQGVLVTHSPTENNWAGVAEGSMAMMLTVLKKQRERDTHVKAGGWRRRELEGTYIGARDIDGYPGLTIGLIGFGRIAKRFAELLAPWRVTIIAHTLETDDPDFQRLNVRPVPLEELLRLSDVVSIHCNLTQETANLISGPELALMKESAILMNTARGGIVDLDALAAATAQGRIAGAALDVFPQEPPDFSHPIFGLGDKVLLAPHMVANNVGSGLPLAIPLVTDNILKALSGELPRHIVNPEAIPLWQRRFGGRSLL